jgi:threonine synthase
VLVDEDEVLEIQSRLALEEGLLVEPAGATSVAGCLRAAASGRLSGSKVVCLLTGHGFKDPASVAGMAARHPVRDITRNDIASVLN